MRPLRSRTVARTFTTLTSTLYVGASWESVTLENPHPAIRKARGRPDPFNDMKYSYDCAAGTAVLLK
jgi:hypothetical protein